MPKTDELFFDLLDVVELADAEIAAVSGGPEVVNTGID